MEVGNKLEMSKAKFYQLFYTDKDQFMVYEIGIVTLIGLILTPVAWSKIDTHYKKTYILFLVLGLILSIMTLTIFPFEKFPRILRMIQFTYRLYEFTAFFYACIAAINYGCIIKNFGIKDVLVLSVISILILIPYENKIDYQIRTDEQTLIQGVRVTKNTGRVHAGMASMEYLPSKAFNVATTYIANREDVPIFVNDSEAEMYNYKKSGTNMILELNSVKTDTIIELPYIYYLGYRVHINGKEIDYTESENGFVQINIDTSKCDNEYANITVKYTGTNAMIISLIISIISWIAIIIYCLLTKFNVKMLVI